MNRMYEGPEDYLIYKYKNYGLWPLTIQPEDNVGTIFWKNCSIEPKYLVNRKCSTCLEDKKRFRECANKHIKYDGYTCHPACLWFEYIWSTVPFEDRPRARRY